MKPGQRLTRWWQELCLGRLRTPQDIWHAAQNETPDPASSEAMFFGRDEPITWEAPERLRAPAFMRTEAFLRQWDRADWQHCDLRLVQWAARFQIYARKRGIPLYVHTAWRGEVAQNALEARGFSNVRFPNSAHNIGEAVDIVHGVYHWEMTRQEWDMLGVLGRLVLDRFNAPLPKAARLNLTWGGSWSDPWDPAHWEIADYRSRTRVLGAGQPVRFTPTKAARG